MLALDAADDAESVVGVTVCPMPLPMSCFITNCMMRKTPTLWTAVRMYYAKSAHERLLGSCWGKFSIHWHPSHPVLASVLPASLVSWSNILFDKDSDLGWSRSLWRVALNNLIKRGPWPLESITREGQLRRGSILFILFETERSVCLSEV